MTADRNYSDLQLRMQRRIAKLNKENQQLRESNHYLRQQNLKMRMDFDVMSEQVIDKEALYGSAYLKVGQTARKILHKYRLKRSILREVEQAINN